MTNDAGYVSLLLLGKEIYGMIFFRIALTNQLLGKPTNGKGMQGERCINSFCVYSDVYIYKRLKFYFHTRKNLTISFLLCDFKKFSLFQELKYVLLRYSMKITSSNTLSKSHLTHRYFEAKYGV